MGNGHPLSDKQDFILWLKGQPETIDMTPTGAPDGAYCCRCVFAQYLRDRTGEVWSVGPLVFGTVVNNPENRHATPDWVVWMIRKIDAEHDGFLIERDVVLDFAKRVCSS